MRNPIVTLVVASVLAFAFAAPALAQETDSIAVLESDASLREKLEACRKLSLTGDRAAVPALATLLVDEKLSHMARYALEPMPYPEAGQALRDALGKTSGRLKVGMVSSLAARRDKQAVPDLIALLSDADADVAQAAARALGTIATPEGAKALEDAIDQANQPPGNLRAICDALFNYAEMLAETGQRSQAMAIYDRILDIPNAPQQVRTGAMRGAILTRGSEYGLPLFEEALRGDNDDQFAAALRVSREMGGEREITAAMAAQLPSLTAERKVRLIQALGDRNGADAGPVVLAEAEEGPIEVRVAALSALARMGYTPSLKLMEHLAWAEDGELATVARHSLSHFPGEAGDAVLRAMLESDEAKARCVAIELTRQGGMAAPVGLLMKMAQTDQDESVRLTALRALEDFAGLEQMPGLLGRLIEARSQSEMQAAEAALAALCSRQKKAPSAENVVIQEAVYGALPDGPSTDVTEKVALIVKSGSLSVEASNSNFGDPAPGVPKKLRVAYTESGTALSSTIGENETLRLASASAPAEIVDALFSALDAAQGETKVALLRILSVTGSPKALETVRTAAFEGEGTVREGALRALCEWPGLDALPTIMELVGTAPDETLKLLALRGAVRLLKQSKLGTAELLQHHAALMDHARTADEKKLVLSSLAQVHHVDALATALGQFGDESVKAEARQAATAIAKNLGKSAREDKSLLNLEDLTGWQGDMAYWRIEDGVIVGQSDTQIPRSDFLWCPGEVGDFYLAVDVKLEPPSANSGIQFRSKKIDEHGQARGYQADIGENVWGRLYHEQGRGKLDWNDRAEKAVKPGDWNRYEILAVGPAIWTAINGRLGVAFLDVGAEDERSGGIAFQIHAGPPQTVRYRIKKLVHDPEVKLEKQSAEKLIAALSVPKEQ
ncbi:MAG: DUF1080 domain-containing protein [Nitrospiraceae bacterium]|nr:DUF1080 domain-containing protein [Nitrospiraceae bacterium]